MLWDEQHVVTKVRDVALGGQVQTQSAIVQGLQDEPTAMRRKASSGGDPVALYLGCLGCCLGCLRQLETGSPAIKQCSEIGSNSPPDQSAGGASRQRCLRTDPLPTCIYMAALVCVAQQPQAFHHVTFTLGNSSALARW